MILGVVHGTQEKKTPALAYSHGGKPQKEIATVPTHLEGAVKIPQYHKESSIVESKVPDEKIDLASYSRSCSIDRLKRKNKKMRRRDSPPNVARIRCGPCRLAVRNGQRF
jgi:hypothetical protein